MYINFQQNRVCKSVKTVHTNLFAKIASCIKLQLWYVFKNLLFHTCVIVKRTCISIFSKLGLVDQSKSCTLIYWKKNDKLHKFATTNSNLKKSILLDMHHHKTYMYIDFQQNRVNSSVITVHTNLFTKIESCINLQLPIIIFKNRLF